MKEFKFFLITDTHFFKNSIGAYGDGYEAFMEYEQKCYAETEAINRAVFEYLKNSDEADTVLIAGDLSFNGEKESHLEFSKMLGELKASGKRVFVVTAGHDIKSNPFSFPGTPDKVPVEGIKFADLYDLYGDFGYKDAVAFNREHMSYVADLSDDVRLLVLCGDTAEGSNIPYSKEFLGWVKQQLDRAKLDGKTVIAMEHYPVIPGQPILTFIGDAYLKQPKPLINTLADNGCHLIFTGHMHNQSINVTETALGNKLYDVCTGSVIGCPAFMRLCTVKDENTVQINSIPVPDFEWDTKGLSCEDYLKKQFDCMIVNLLTAMRDDPGRAMRKIGVKESEPLKKFVQKVGAGVCSLSVGKTAKLFAVKAEPEIADMPLIDLLAAVVRNIFCGDQPYTDQSPEGRTLLKIIGRFRPALNIISGKIHDARGEKVDLYDIIKNSLGNYGISDNNAELKLK